MEIIVEFDCPNLESINKHGQQVLIRMQEGGNTMTMQEFEEKLKAIEDEAEALRKQRPDFLAELGEKALPALRGNDEFADLTGKIDEIDEKIEELAKSKEELLGKKGQYEKEERERILKYTCPQCKKVNSEDAKFCEDCGAPVVGVLPREYCEVCGTVNHVGLKFCGECGAKLPE